MSKTRIFATPELVKHDLSSKVVQALPNPPVKQPPSFFQKFESTHLKWAKELHNAAIVYAIYGALDGFSMSYSVIKLAFDMLLSDSSGTSKDSLHDWMSTPGGFITGATETVAIIALSMIANTVSTNPSSFNRFIVFLWPYVRDTMKGLKNAYKGIRSSLQAFGTLSGQNLQNLIVPVGALLGVLSAANLIWYRQMKVVRKAQQIANGQAALEIQSLDHMDDDVKAIFRKGYDLCLDDDGTYEKNKLYFSLHEGMLRYKVLSRHGMVISGDIECVNDVSKAKTKDPLIGNFKSPLTVEQLRSFLPQIMDITSARKHTYRTQGIQSQCKALRIGGISSAAFGGVIFGLYNYMGVMAVSVLAPQVFVGLLVCSMIFTVVCISTKMYEEYDYQRRLKATEADVELALTVKELQLLFYQLQDLKKLEMSLTQSAEKTVDVHQALLNCALKKETLLCQIHAKLPELQQKREEVRRHVTVSYQSAVLQGLKNGLAAYTAMEGLMFAIATMSFLFSFAFPPALVVATVVAGMVCLVGFLAHALINNHQHLQKKKEGGTSVEFEKLLKVIDSKVTNALDLEPEKVKAAAEEDSVVEASPQTFFEEWFEVLRSFFTGVSKAQKTTDFALSPVQPSADPGHSDPSSLLLWATGVSSWIFALGLAFRAYARGLGENAAQKLPKPKPEMKDIKPKTSLSKTEKKFETDHQKVIKPAYMGPPHLKVKKPCKISEPKKVPIENNKPTVKPKKSDSKVVLPEKVLQKVVPPEQVVKPVVSIVLTETPKVEVKVKPVVVLPKPQTRLEQKISHLPVMRQHAFPVIREGREEEVPWKFKLFDKKDELVASLKAGNLCDELEQERSEAQKASQRGSLSTIPEAEFDEEDESPVREESALDLLKKDSSIKGEGEDFSAVMEESSVLIDFLEGDANPNDASKGESLEGGNSPAVVGPTPASGLHKSGSSGVLDPDKLQFQGAFTKKAGSTGDFYTYRTTARGVVPVQISRKPQGFFKKRKIESLADFSEISRINSNTPASPSLAPVAEEDEKTVVMLTEEVASDVKGGQHIKRGGERGVRLVSSKSLALQREEAFWEKKQPITKATFAENVHKSPDLTPDHCTFYVGNES